MSYFCVWNSSHFGHHFRNQWTECMDQTGQDKAEILIGQEEILSKPFSSSLFNSESHFFILLCFYFLWFQMVSISCLSSCLLLKNLKHLSLPIMNRLKDIMCMWVTVCVCLYLCSIWSHGAVTLSHQHATVKFRQTVKFTLMMLINLCLTMSSWCNNVQLSCSFSIRFAS